MVLTRKIDDIGRIAIPKDLRRSLRWMGGDEIEIVPKDNGEIILRKHQQSNAIPILNELRQGWKDDLDIDEQFNELIKMIESKTE